MCHGEYFYITLVKVVHTYNKNDLEFILSLFLEKQWGGLTHRYCVSSSVRNLEHRGTHFLQHSPALVSHTHFKQTAPEDNKSWWRIQQVPFYLLKDSWTAFTHLCRMKTSVKVTKYPSIVEIQSAVSAADQDWIIVMPAGGRRAIASKAVSTGFDTAVSKAARLVFNEPKRAHVTPLFVSLHWLPVSARIKFKTLMFAYRTTTGSAPTYFHSLLQIYTPSRSLRSASERRLVVPSQRGSKSLSRTFSFTVPGWWNDLPTLIRNAGSSLYLLWNYLF